MKKHKISPLADIMPKMTEREYKEFRESIRKQGLLTTIKLDKNGSIIDGRHRERACDETGVKPRYEVYRGKDPLGFIMGLNVERRHLNESQRAMVGARYIEIQSNTEAHRVNGEPAAAAVTQEYAAKKIGIGRRSLQRAVKVKAEADASVVKSVDGGGMTLRTAEKLAGMPRPIQKQVARSDDPERAAKAAIKAPPGAADESEPWDLFNIEIQSVIRDLRGSADHLRKALEYDSASKQLKGRYARAYSHSGTIGAILSIIRTLEQGMPADKSNKPPGYLTVAQYEGRKSMGGGE